MDAPVSSPSAPREEISVEEASGSPLPPSRAQALRRLRMFGAAVVLLPTLMIWSWYFQSIRSDPYTDNPGWWESFTKPEPHPALAQIPVLPMGAAGILSWRPEETGWLAGRLAASPGTTGGKASALIGPAYADKKPRARQQKVPVTAPEAPASKAPDTPQGSSADAVPTATVPPVHFTPALDTIADLRRVPSSKSIDAAASNALASAACDSSQRACVRQLDGSWMFSKDGGLNWQPSGWTESDPKPSLLFVVPRAGNGAVLAGRVPNVPEAPLGFNDYEKGEVGLPDDVQKAASQAAMGLLWPMSAILYRLDDEQEIAPTTSAGRAVWTGLFDELRAVAVESPAPNMVALVSDREGKALAFALYGNGWLLRSDFLLPSPVTPSSRPEPIRPTRRDLSLRKLDTNANLRSLRMYDMNLGWISSGWNDGNAESPYPAILQTEDGGRTWEHLSYRRLPPPWVLFLGLPAFAFALFGSVAALGDLKRARMPEQSIEGSGIADAPIGWHDEDVLDLKPVALALSRFVRNADTIPPMTIAVAGPWGTGKSSLMNLIKEDLEWRGARPVWFNAWHHQKEELILAALLENIRAQAIPPIWTLSGLWYRARLLLQRILAKPVPYIAVVLSIALLWHVIPRIWNKLEPALPWAAKLFSAMSEADPNTLSKLGIPTGLVALALLFLRLSSSLKLNPSELMASLRRNAKSSELTAQLSFRYKFAKEFNAVGRALRSRSNPGLVIFIDDLDRCSSTNLVEVLEAVNFLATAGPCFIFLGMDEHKVVDIVAQELAANKTSPPAQNDKDRAAQYLKKLINVTVPIPEFSAESTAHLLRIERAPAAQKSEWPRTIRRWLRIAPDVAVPLFSILVAVGYFATLVSAWSPDTASTTPPVPPPAADSKAGEPPPATTAPAQAQPNPAPTRPEVSVERLHAGSPVLVALVVLSLVALVILFYFRRAAVQPEDRVEDSRTFREALTIWHPVIFAADPTPRGVKRQQNRLRLYAMRLRSEIEEQSFLDDVWKPEKGRQPSVMRIILRLLQGRREPPPQEARSVGMAEPTLVALGAIEGLCGRIPDWTLAVPRTLPASGATPESKDVVVARIVEKSLGDFEHAFAASWPPSSNDIKRFRACGSALRTESG